MNIDIQTIAIAIPSIYATLWAIVKGVRPIVEKTKTKKDDEILTKFEKGLTILGKVMNVAFPKTRPKTETKPEIKKEN